MNALDRRLRAQRPAKPTLDVWRPIAVQEEEERAPEGHIESCLTLFLAGRECPFTCIFCDLWRYTTDVDTPIGAIPTQIRAALAEASKGSSTAESFDTLKLYNAANFFDARAVPPADDAEILELVAGARRVVVECHAKLIGERCARFARQLQDRGSKLEVAVGFETVHAKALAKLNKRVTERDLRAAASRLQSMGADLRAFILIGVPFIAQHEALHWLERSVEAALESGARLISLIPLRGADGEMSRLEQSAEWRAPNLEEIEAAFERGRALSSKKVRLDTWDLESLATTEAQKKRVQDLRRAQLEPLRGAIA